MNTALSSHLKKHICDFIELKQASGFLYTSPIHWLITFDRFCLKHHPYETQLTKKIVMHWAEKRSHESVKTLECRIVVIRQLAKFLNRMGYSAYIIPAGIPSKIPRYIPHIFTEQELKAFFTLTDKYPYKKTYPVRDLVIPVIFRVLYCCGLRSSEILSLKISDVDLGAGKLFIRQTKGNKDRIVMLSEDVLNLCRIYHKKVSLILPSHRYFFPNQIGEKYNSGFLRYVFHECWERMQTTTNVAMPHVHNFRHTFSVKRLNLWVQEGKVIQAYLPYLSMYLGHASLSETDYYLHLVPEFFPIMTSLGEEQLEYLIPEVNYEE